MEAFGEALMALIVLAAMVAWFALIGLGAYVSKEKGRPVTEGVWLAILFGPFGVLIAALLPTQYQTPAAPALKPPPPSRAERVERFSEPVDDEQARRFLSGQSTPTK